jgi:DNA-directed RNA polymerase specialized sigma24 family protein
VLDVRQTLARLEPRDRTVLLLRYSGFSYAEIANAVGVKPGSVGTTLARAQQRFKDAYESAHVRAAGPNSHDTDGTSKGSDPDAL